MKYVLTALLLIGQFSVAETSKETIPFLIERKITRQLTPAEVKMMNMGEIGTTRSPVMLTADKNDIENIDAEQLKNLVKKIKAAICGDAKGVTFKVWIKLGADGKFLGIGALAEGGIEVTVKCSGD